MLGRAIGVICCALIACGGADVVRSPVVPAPAVSVAISPPDAIIAPGQTMRFTATVENATNTEVRWTADAGAIEQDGSWTAPQEHGDFKITAQSVADPAKDATASALVTDGVVRIWLEPTEMTIPAGSPPFQFQSRVTGTRDNGVTWSIEAPAQGCSIDAEGAFTSLFEGTCRVVVTSNADPAKAATAAVTTTRDLIDHGGPVMTATRTFALWWGDPSAFPDDAREGVEALLRGLNGSAYLAVADQYMRGVRATTTFAGSLFDPSTPPRPPDVVAFVRDAACRALDANGIAPQLGDFVFVHTPDRVMDARWCASHGFMVCRGQSIMIAHLPNPAGGLCDDVVMDACGTGYSSPTRSLITAAAHEFMEGITDPFATGWYGGGLGGWGGEVADKCGNLQCVPLPTGVVRVGDLYSNAIHGCTTEPP